MSKKSKLITALAVGAVLLILGTSVARCSIVSSGNTSVEEPGVSTQASSSAGATANDQTCEFKGFAGSTWSMDDGTELALSDTTIVLVGKDATTVYYYTIDEESRNGSNLNATLSISKTMNGEQSMAIVAIASDQDGSQSLTCDQLGGTYKRNAEGPVHIELSGSNEELYTLFGKDKQDFEQALSDFAKAKSPHATKATWDKEAWVDYAAKTMIANFTLDDATGTFVSVTCDASGRLIAQ